MVKKIRVADEVLDKYTDNYFSSDKVFKPIHFVFIEKMMDLSSTKLSFIEELKKMDLPPIDKGLLSIIPFIEEIRHPHNLVRNNMMLLGIRGGAINPEIEKMMDECLNIDEFKFSERYEKEIERVALMREKKRTKIESTLSPGGEGSGVSTICPKSI